MKSNEFGTSCHFCCTGKISTRFVKEGSGACQICINRIPKRTHVEDRYRFLITDLQFKEKIQYDKIKANDALADN